MKYTTKKTSTTSLIIGLIFTAVIVYFAFHCQSLADVAAKRWQHDNEEMLRTVSTVLFVFAVVELYGTICGYLSYADVHENKICGKGLKFYGYAISDFNLDFEHVIDMSMVMNKLRIKTASESIDVITTPARGQEIISYYRSVKK